MGKPWFGRKRFGWGFRPQTWQGWLVMILLCAAIVLFVRLVGR